MNNEAVKLNDQQKVMMRRIGASDEQTKPVAQNSVANIATNAAEKTVRTSLVKKGLVFVFTATGQQGFTAKGVEVYNQIIEADAMTESVVTPEPTPAFVGSVREEPIVETTVQTQDSAVVEEAKPAKKKGRKEAVPTGNGKLPEGHKTFVFTLQTSAGELKFERNSREQLSALSTGMRVLRKKHGNIFVSEIMCVAV